MAQAASTQPSSSLPLDWSQVDLDTMELPWGYARLLWPIEAGLTSRGRVRRAFLGTAYTYGLHVKVQEDMGLLASLYRFTVVGPEAHVRSFDQGFRDWARSVGAEIETSQAIELSYPTPVGL